MPAAPASEPRRLGVALLSRFALVGIASTALYAVLALLFSEWPAVGLPPVQASLLAYACCAVFSYLGHKFVTFMSAGEHRREAPRFLLVTALGFGLAAALPAILSEGLGLPAAVPVLATCILIPAINLLVLNRWVFVGRGSS